MCVTVSIRIVGSCKHFRIAVPDATWTAITTWCVREKLTLDVGLERIFRDALKRAHEELTLVPKAGQ